MKKPKKCRECERREKEQERRKALWSVLYGNRPGDVLQLEPCAACGGRAVVNVKNVGVGAISCEKCGHGVVFIQTESVFKEAIDAWNTGTYLKGIGGEG